MDFAINWSPEAAEDLELIADYIARDTRIYARSVVSKILNAFYESINPIKHKEENYE